MKAGPHQHHHFNFDDGFLFGDWGAVDQIKNDNAEQYCCADDSPTSDACEQMMFAQRTKAAITLRPASETPPQLQKVMPEQPTQKGNESEL